MVFIERQVGEKKKTKDVTERPSGENNMEVAWKQGITSASFSLQLVKTYFFAWGRFSSALFSPWGASLRNSSAPDLRSTQESTATAQRSTVGKRIQSALRGGDTRSVSSIDLICGSTGGTKIGKDEFVEKMVVRAAGATFSFQEACGYTLSSMPGENAYAGD